MLEAQMRPAHRGTPFFGFVRVGVPALIVLLALGGTGAYAYESDNVIPEHPLYPVKRAVEQVEAAATALSAEASTAARARRVTHRLAEAKKLEPGTASFREVLADVDYELAQTALHSPRNASRSLVHKLDENTFENLEGIAKKDPERSLSPIEQLIVLDAERIERHLPEQPTEEQRQFVAERLARRRSALEALNPMVDMVPAPRQPTPVDPSVDGVLANVPFAAPPTFPSKTEPTVLQKPEPVRLTNTPSAPLQPFPETAAPKPYRPVAPATNVEPVPALNTNTSTVLPSREPSRWPAPAAPVNTTQLFPHPESINGVPWSKLTPEVRVRYYREYLLRLQYERRQTGGIPTTTIQPK
jgi:hypothetical protein